MFAKAEGTNTLLHIAASFGMLFAVKGGTTPMATTRYPYTIFRPLSVCKHNRLHVVPLSGRPFNFRRGHHDRDASA